ncbi:DMT family transporter [Aestuariirhabdus litorea]|uniref:DMT family transporter n=1 Tax=Aestuariirhabdus litorea TaxID=2528527 RepID=A0A3P3VNJ8_9GAMM|nr:DMT family transporter [Aestuariirhabdus litorea]RRJ83917.1 DMT family transporter [Aestuariirhabdus litorea]RWW97139.1 DMT family transporter [Endozoicomonadaceae bacterium GTF-13]
MSNPLYRGALFILLSELLLVLSGATIRQLAHELPNEVIVFCRNLFALGLLLPWLMRQGSAAIQTRHIRFHLMRAAVGVSAMYCLYYSWAHLPLAEAALFKQTAPFFIPVIALLWLGEQIPRSVRIAIGLGFLGVALILKPGAAGLNPVLLVALAGALLGALAKVTIRRMASTEPSTRIVFYFALFTSLLSVLPALMNWVTPSTQGWGLILLMAALSTGAQLSLSHAYALAPAGRLGPFTYSSILFATLLGWLLWAESLALATLIGMGLVIAAGVLAVADQLPRRKPL